MTPLTAGAAAGAETAGLPAARVLAVDDSPENLLALRAALEPCDYELAQAESGEDALRRMLLSDYAAVILDVAMPGLDGFQVAEIMRRRERTRHVPILFVTAMRTDLAAHLKGYQLGAIDYLERPLEPQVLRAKVGALVDVHRRSVEARLRAAALLAEEHAENERRLADMVERNALLAESGRTRTAFVAALSHELRTPLTSLLGFVRVLLDPRADPLSARQKGHLEDALACGGMLMAVLNDALDMARADAGRLDLRLQAVPIASLLEEMARMMGTQAAARRIRLGVEPGNDGECVLLDPVKVKQILFNLVSNALKFTPPGGRVAMRALKTEGGCLRLEVDDTGPGVPPADRERIFDEFERLHRNGTPPVDGTGLGLALARRLARAHGGRIGVEDNPPRGSRFFVELPLDGAAPSVETAAAQGTRRP